MKFVLSFFILTSSGDVVLDESYPVFDTKAACVVEGKRKEELFKEAEMPVETFYVCLEESEDDALLMIY